MNMNLALNELSGWEDYIAYYQRLEELSHSVSWEKADTLLALSKQFGDRSLYQFALQIGEPISTVVSYVRVAKAFPRETRQEILPFSVHLAVSYVDQYSKSENEFTTQDRFTLLEEAANNNLSTREVKKEIQEIKRRAQAENGIVDFCQYCRKSNPEIIDYQIVSSDGNVNERFLMHEYCYQKLIERLRNA